MTCIVGIVHKNRIHLGCDSAFTAGDTKHSNDNIKLCTKIIGNKLTGNMNDKIILGLTGSLGVSCKLQYELNLSKLIMFDGADDDTTMYTAILPEIKKLVKEYYKEDRDLTVKDINMEILIGWRAKLYVIYSDFSMTVHSDFVSVGSGYNVAMGSLYTTSKLKMEPEKRIQLALEAATYRITSVAAPFKFESI